MDNEITVELGTARRRAVVIVEKKEGGRAVFTITAQYGGRHTVEVPMTPQQRDDLIAALTETVETV